MEKLTSSELGARSLTVGKLLEAISILPELKDGGTATARYPTTLVLAETKEKQARSGCSVLLVT